MFGFLYFYKKLTRERTLEIYSPTFPVVQRLRLLAPNAGDLGSTPDQGTRSHLPQLRVPMLQLGPSAAKINSFKTKIYSKDFYNVVKYKDGKWKTTILWSFYTIRNYYTFPCFHFFSPAFPVFQGWIGNMVAGMGGVVGRVKDHCINGTVLCHPWRAW